MAEIKNKLEELRKKHDLPGYDELAKEFEIDSIEKTDFLLREIRKKAHNRIKYFCGLLEEVLQPDTNISAIYESRVFGEKEKKDVFDAYRKFMALNREGEEAAINSDDAAFIKKVYKEIGVLKADLLPIIAKMREAWQKDTPDDEKLGYFG